MAKRKQKKAQAKKKTVAKRMQSVAKKTAAPAKKPLQPHVTAPTPSAPLSVPLAAPSAAPPSAPALETGPFGEPIPQMQPQANTQRHSIHVELGEKLAAVRGNEQEERAVIAQAIEAFMRHAIARGLAANASAYSAQCPEFFWEGDGVNPPVYARVPDATHDEIGRWFQLIVEGVRAYDARVGATA